MKPEAEESSGALARFAALFTANWGLKLLALVRAIVIYHTLTPAGRGGSVSADVKFTTESSK